MLLSTCPVAPLRVKITRPSFARAPSVRRQSRLACPGSLANFGHLLKRSVGLVTRPTSELLVFSAFLGRRKSEGEARPCVGNTAGAPRYRPGFPPLSRHRPFFDSLILAFRLRRTRGPSYMCRSPAVLVCMHCLIPVYRLARNDDNFSWPGRTEIT